MKAEFTIPEAIQSHKFLWERPLQALPLLTPSVLTCVSGLLLMNMCGCSLPANRSAQTVPTWELADAKPINTRSLVRMRVDPDRTIPEEMLQPLCDEYALVLVRNRQQWESLAQALDVPPFRSRANFQNGMIVGILARVGESAETQWPAVLQEARIRDGLGWLIVYFHKGVYYPVHTAGYLELVYIPRLERIRRVDINTRRFALLLPDEVPPEPATRQSH